VEEQVHDDEVVVSDGLARALIDSQFPDDAGLALSRVPSAGTVNVIYRLGAELSARFPRRAGDAAATRGALERAADCAAEFSREGG
jgi:aminoglycoside phosphotransferase (APT) family kinase protein